MIRVSSFDVFDTCLTRIFAYPVDLFVEVGEVSLKNGWVTIDSREFAARRILAEHAARNSAPSREVSLAQIYRELGLNLGLAPKIILEIQNTELLIEGQSLQPISETRFRIAEARRQGRQILFLSDMYLPTLFLEGLLRKHEFYEDGDFLYISGEVGRHKGDGGLFQHARDLLKKDVTEWVHLGDNKNVDVMVPRRMGLQAEHFESGLLNRYELQICPGFRFRQKVERRLLAITRLDRLKIISQRSPRIVLREKWKSHFVAAMRLARLAKPDNLDSQQKVIWDIGANVAGPLFYGYVKWMLNQAEEKKLSRLYFIARDGQILIKIAEIVQSFQNSSIDCRYLYGSRHAWLPASLDEIDASHLRWILAPTPSLCVQEVFSRLEISTEKHRQLLESSGFSEETWKKPIVAPLLKRLAAVLRNPVLSSEIKTMAKVKREGLLQYLRYEGFFEQTEIGLVDLGWRGSLQEALVRVCEKAPDPIKPQVSGFYLALVDSPHQNDEGFSGYINSLCPDSVGDFLFYMQLLEAFAVADHGQTRDYQDGLAILSSPGNPAASKWGLEALQGGILAFCRAYGALDNHGYRPEEYLDATLSSLKLFYEDPTLNEVKAWGSFPFSDQQVENNLEPLLPSWNRSQTRAALLTKDGRKRLWWAPALAKREGMNSLHLYYKLQKLWRTRLKSRAR